MAKTTRYYYSKFWRRGYPITFLNRLTLYSWGWDLKLRKVYLTFSRGGHRPWLYLSPDATPSHPRAKFLWRGPKRWER